MVLAILSVLLLFNSAPTASDVTNRSCTSWKQAEAVCRKRGLQLPIIIKDSDYQKFGKSMDMTEKDTIWLGLKRRNYDEFRWLDCSKPSKWIMNRRINESFHCGYLNTSAKQIETGTCSTGRGVLCSVPDCHECEPPRCMNILGRCYAMSCMSRSWEAAKVYCTTRWGHLAVLPERHDQDTVLMLSNNWPSSYCNEVWVGLSKQEWTYDDDNSAQLVNYWEIGEPSEKGDCSVMEKMGSYKGWKAVSCGRRYQYTCQKDYRIEPTDGPHYDVKSPSTESQVNDKDHGSVNATIIAALVCTFCLICTMIIALFLMSKWHAKTRFKMRYHTFDFGQELLPMSAASRQTEGNHPHMHMYPGLNKKYQDFAKKEKLLKMATGTGSPPESTSIVDS